jgi:preprotein translocase SecE subunit
MINFFYDSLETLQKVKFATKQDYIWLWLGVIFSIIVCGAFFIWVDTIWSWAYKTFYSIMKSDSLESQLYEDNTTLSGADVSISGTQNLATGVVTTPSTGS